MEENTEQDTPEIITLLYALYINQRRTLDLLYVIAEALNPEDAEEILLMHKQGKIASPETALTVDDDEDA